MVDEEQTEEGEASQTTSQESQTEFTSELSVIEQPFEHDVNINARASPSTHTSPEFDGNHSWIPILKRKHEEDSSGSISESSLSGDESNSASGSLSLEESGDLAFDVPSSEESVDLHSGVPNLEESVGLDSSSPSLEARPGFPLRILNDFLFARQDQMLFVTLSELGPNWELISDVMASVGVFLTPESCKQKHQLYKQQVTGVSRIADLPSRNWITREVIEEVQRKVVHSNAENSIRQISMIHSRRCEKLRTQYPREVPFLAHVAQNELRQDAIGPLRGRGQFKNPTEAFTKARKQTISPSMVLKPHRPTSGNNNALLKDSLHERPQNSKGLEAPESLQSQQPLQRQFNLFNDFLAAEATGWHGNRSLGNLGVLSSDLDHSSGLGQSSETSELHTTGSLVNSPTAPADVNVIGTSLTSLNSDFSFDASVLHCLEDLPSTLQFQQLQLDDTKYIDHSQEAKSDAPLGHSVEDSRRDLSKETGQSSYQTMRASRKRLRRHL